MNMKSERMQKWDENNLVHINLNPESFLIFSFIDIIISFYVIFKVDDFSLVLLIYC